MSDARKKITKTVVDKLQPSEIVWDADVRGFAVRCQRRDRVYVLKYRLNGRQRWYTIGKHGSPWTVERARNEARRILGHVAEGKDPASEKQSERDLPTVADLAALFLAEHVGTKSSKRTEAEYRRLVERFVKPELGRRKVDDVTSADIRKLHFKLRSTPYQANRVLALLSKLFSWSGRRGERNPCIGIERYAEQKRRRYLSQAELARLGAALHDAEGTWASAESLRAEIDADRKALTVARRGNDEEAARKLVQGITERQRALRGLDGLVSAHAIAAVRLLIFTGARLNEVLTLEWAHVDLDRSCLNLPQSKTGPKAIHLNPPALAVLAQQPRLAGNPYVIPGERAGRHLVNLEKPWRRIREAAGLPDVRLHDLRHSFASVGAGAGLGLPIIGALLGHTQAATTARYAHLADDPLRQANDLIGARLAAAMQASGQGAAVVRLKGGK